MKELTKLLEEYTRDSVGFLKEQAPEFIEELLRFEFISNLIEFSMLFLILLCLAIGSFIVTKSLIKEIKLNRNCDYSALACTSIFGWFFTFIFLVLSFQPGVELVKIKVAPKVFVIDYLRSEK